METAGLYRRSIKVIGIIGYTLGTSRDSGKEHGNYCSIVG